MLRAASNSDSLYRVLMDSAANVEAEIVQSAQQRVTLAQGTAPMGLLAPEARNSVRRAVSRSIRAEFYSDRAANRRSDRDAFALAAEA